ncbi:MAG: TRAP transporter substrate-binding protein DctP [Actinomycetota bacterium]|nr:TRAP transporter substrate-binding protein DctP [Actinomycetota bacterium]
MARKRWLLLMGPLLMVVLLTGCGLASDEGAGEVNLRLGHQWPGVDSEGEGDFRAVLAQRFADRVSEETDGQVNIEIYPNNSLVEDPTEQYQAITEGAQDMSVFPLDYASGDVPAFSITLMPAMVPGHAEARNWQDAEIGQRVEELTEENGVKVLTWVWNAGAIGTTSTSPIVSPDDVPSGNVTRAAGVRIEEMLERVGFGIASMPSSEIYSAMQTGVLDSAITSTSSFDSFRLYEQVATYTSPTGGYTFWFMFEPLIISMDKFEQLTSEQQQILEDVGAELQEFAYTASEEDDVRIDGVFEEAGVNVVQMDAESFERWREESQATWESLAEEVQNGRELIDLAQQVSAQ